MIVLPAIDLKNGQCVRLKQGIKEDATIYSSDPVETARGFEAMGTQYLHMVDLDGAFDGMPRNLTLIERVVSALNIPVELGGGIRDIKTAEQYLNAGVARVIIGTRAVNDLAFVKELISRFTNRIAVSIDAKDGYACTKGWTETSDKTVMALARELEDAGVATLICTDISRDGMLSGPNFELLGELNEHFDMDIIASGGVASEAHLQQAKDMGLYGAITGRAVYEKTLDLAAWLKKEAHHAG